MANAVKMTVNVFGEKEIKAQIASCCKDAKDLGSVIKIGRGKNSKQVCLRKCCGGVNKNDSFEIAEKWFDDDCFFGTENHVLIATKNGNLFCATIFN